MGVIDLLTRIRRLERFVKSTKPFNPENTGSNDDVLSKTSTGYKWVNGLFKPSNAGSTDNVLTKTSTGYKWAAPSGGGAQFYNGPVDPTVYVHKGNSPGESYIEIALSGGRPQTLAVLWISLSTSDGTLIKINRPLLCIIDEHTKIYGIDFGDVDISTVRYVYFSYYDGTDLASDRTVLAYIV